MNDLLTTPDSKTTQTTIDSIEGFKPMNNYVLVKQFSRNIDRKTKSGIWLVAEKTKSQSQHVDRIFEVVALPDRLICNQTQVNKSQRVQKTRDKIVVSYYKELRNEQTMSWQCDMELSVGDHVVGSYLESINFFKITAKEGEFFLFHYRDLYVARRLAPNRNLANRIKKYVTVDEVVYEIIPLNGYLICEEIPMPRLSKLDFKDRIDHRFAKIKYAGRPLKGEEDNVKPGDVVVKTPGIHYKLESEFHSEFFGKKQDYIIIQRKHIYAIV